jgi:hypothetical protein
MKKLFTTSLLVLGLLATNAQDLSIGNISAGYEYNQSTGIIKDIYFTILSNENDGATNFKVGIYFVPPGATSLDDALLLESANVPSIGGNASKDVTNWTINVNNVSNVPPNGSYRLLVYVDSDKSITESDESNNGLFISAQGDDLTFTAGSTTGINDLQNIILSVSSFPNPSNTTSKLTFSLAQNTTGGIQVFDIQGKKIVDVLNENTTLLAGSHCIDIETGNLNSGVYYCVLKTKEGSYTHKLIKQ